MKTLPVLIHATRMLVCGEYFGMIPACVPQVMNDLQILSLEIQRMPKELCEFGDLKRNPYLSVCTISTHDMPTLRGWWLEDHARATRYYHEVLHHEGEAPRKATGKLCDDIVRARLDSPSI